MNRKRLGRCDLEVAPVSLGAVKLGRNTGVRYPSRFELPDDGRVVELLQTALDLGVNLIDTAPAYGVSEQRLGRLLPGGRQDWIICTKAGENYADGKSSFDFSGAGIAQSVSRSLRRLQTDYLDIVLVHSDGNDLDILERSDAMATLAQLKRKGDVRYIGMSPKTLAGGLAAVEASDVLMVTLNPDDTSQLPVIRKAAGQNTGILLKKVLASGHADAPGSLRFALAQAGVHSAVVGTINPEHLRENVSAATG